MLIGRCSWELSGRKLQRKIKKSQTLSSAQDDVFVGVLKKNIPNRLALMGRSPFQRSLHVQKDRGQELELWSME
jgi:hypothetical protein